MTASPAIAWVKYSAQGALIRLLRVSPAAELAHRRFCDLVWTEGVWPDARGELAHSLARVPKEQWPAIFTELRVLGWRRKGPHLVNPAVARIRTAAEKARAAAVERARIGADARWHDDGPDTPMREASSKHPARMLPPCRLDGQESRQEGTDRALNASERLPRTVLARKGESPQKEKQFLGDVREAFSASSGDTAAKELRDWGGWWRNRYRENPGKAGRVLADIRSLIREGKILSNPGAAAVDLWSRLP